MSDLQAAFDRIVRGLAAQGWERAFDEDGEFCVYIDERGRGCALGHVMTREQAIAADVDAIDPEDVAEHFPDNRYLAALLADPAALAYEVRAAHDREDSPDQRRDFFRTLASRWGLRWPDLPKADHGE